MKLRIVSRKIYNYIRYDLKEIAFPSSLPDPPNTQILPKLTLHQKYLVLKHASRLYIASWTRDIGPDLRPHDHTTNSATEDREEKEGMEMSSWEELAVAARGGMETLRPALQRVYMMRASAYRDGLKAFVEGYQDGIKEVMEGRERSESEKKGNGENKTL
ncbi:hypothetical protein LUZ60_003834 [Juncus effusus]|nr:hypothetical protein LUZ60_003834 [Juncus effusus]